MADINLVVGGRYKIIQELGKGSYGETYLAEDCHLPGNPTCVVKKFSPLNTSPRNIDVGLRLFRQEAEMLYRLGKHEQIPELLASFFDEEDCNYYLVQEFVDGKDLTEKIQNKLGEADVVQLLIDILDVLEYIHQQSVIHRDLKPSNILCRTDEKIVLIDFGAVKEVSVIDEGQPSSTVAIGTSGYRPSEQANGKPRFSSDVYAVGMIAIQALTGIHPKDLSEEPSTGEVVWQHHVNISSDLAAVLTKMVRFHFSQRYQSVLEVLAELNRLQNRSYVDIVAETREVLNLLATDVRMISGGIVLPQVRLFLSKKIDNFENLYSEYSNSLSDKKLTTFLCQICEGTAFEVDVIHPAKLVLKNKSYPNDSIHSESSYRKILMDGHRKFNLSSSKRMIEVARLISLTPIHEQRFSELLESISSKLPVAEPGDISNSLLAFFSAGCFETEPVFGPPWNRVWTLKPGFESEEKLLEALQYGVRNRLREALMEIDEEVETSILKRLIP